MKVTTVTSVKNIPRGGQRANPNMREATLSDGTVVFASYSTPVAAHVPGKGYMRTSRKWSVTTTKHVNLWLARQNAGNVAEVDQDVLDALLPDDFSL